ncbi:MAG: inositol monophosphatase family protein [Candidatus Omnitrophota bacterium]
MEDMKRVMEVAVRAAKEAGEYAIRGIGDKREIAYKGGHNNLVTDVDKKCEQIIVDMVKREFPEHSILAEESGAHAAGGAFNWIIDPIDGTTNYAHGFPVFCVSIGIAAGSSVKAGVVYDPSRDELFRAEEGKGAYLNDKRISVSDIGAVRDSLIATGFSYDREKRISNIAYFTTMLEHAQAVRRPGSAAIDLCYIACGRFDGYWEFGLSPWDMAAAQLIVKEAGGTITMLKGRPFDIFQKEIVATNTKIHAEMLGLLGENIN